MKPIKLPDNYTIRKVEQQSFSIWGPRGEVIEKIKTNTIGFKPIVVEKKVLNDPS